MATTTTITTTGSGTAAYKQKNKTKGEGHIANKEHEEATKNNPTKPRKQAGHKARHRRQRKVTRKSDVFLLGKATY